MLSSPTSSSVTSEGTVLHPPIALPPLFSLPLFHSNGLFDQTPIRCDGAHIGQTFSARGSDFPSRVCVPTCPAIRPVGRLSSLPPSSLQPFGVVTAANGNIMHHSRDSCLSRRVDSLCGGGGTNSIDNAGWSAKCLVGIPCSFSLSLPPSPEQKCCCFSSSPKLCQVTMPSACLDNRLI